MELTTFEQHVCSVKIDYANTISLGTNSCKKRNVATFNSTQQAKKQCNFDSGWLERHQCGYIAFSESCEPRRFVRYWNKVERKYIQEQQLNQFLCYNQNMGFVNRMEQNVAKNWYTNAKMVVVSVCLDGRCCSSGCVDIVSY